MVHKQTSYRGSYWPTQEDIFRETIFQPLGGAAPQIFTRATDWPSLASAHPSWDGGPPKILLKIHRMSPYNFGASGSMLTKLFPGDVLRGRGDKMGITFGRPAPSNLAGRKNVQNSARFLITLDFNREYRRNGSTYRKSEKYLINHAQPFRRWTKKRWCTFFHIRKSYWL